MNGDSIACEEISVRLLSKKKHVDSEGHATAEAFLLAEKDEGRLSLFRLNRVDLATCKQALNKVHGTVSLHAGHVRNIKNQALDIVEAEGEGTTIPGHASLVRLPDPVTDFKAAERVASLLRTQCRLI